MPLQFDCKIYVEHAPEIFIDDENLVHVIDRDGDMALERVMSPHSLLTYIERARRAYADWEGRQRKSSAREH